MSQVYQPVGFAPIGRYGNAPYEGGTTTYPLTTNNTAVIAKGDIVALVAGSVVPVTANPVSGTLSANTPVGVVMGFEYSDPINNRTFVCSQLLAANAITNLGYKNVIVLVADDPGLRFTVLCNGSVAASSVGSAVNAGGFGAADTSLKVSRMYADVATIDNSSGSTKAFKIVGIDKALDNAAGDPYTRLVVKFNAGVHQDSFAGAH